MAEEGPGKDWQLGRDDTQGRRQAGKDLNSDYGAMRMTSDGGVLNTEVVRVV